MKKEEAYWNNFYKTWKTDLPSSFCLMVLAEVLEDTAIVEFGCGNGRDAFFMASHGRDVFAVDRSSIAISRNTEINQMNNLRFFQGDVSKKDDVSRVIACSRKKAVRVFIYSRFFLHSITQEEQEIFLEILSTELVPGDSIGFEYRCLQDADRPKIYGGHYRRFVDTSVLTQELESRHFQITYQVSGQGMAKFKQEDPFVSRILATRVEH